MKRANKRSDEPAKQENMDINNAGFQILKKFALQMFYEKGNSTRLSDVQKH